MSTKTKTTYSRFGRKIKDAKENLSIRVKPVDIAGAVCRDHERCVIANAIKRSKRAPWVNVGADFVIVGETPKTGTRFKLDSLGKEVVRYFDTHNGGAGPTALVLNAPPQSMGTAIRNAVAGDMPMPEELFFRVPIFDSRQFTAEVACALEVFPLRQAFRIVPYPGEIAKAMAAALDDVAAVFDKEGPPVFRGTVL